MTNELADRIQKWLSDEGVFRKKVPDDKTSFRFIVNFPENSPNTMGVLQPKGKNDMVIVECTTAISPVHLSKMKGMKNTEKEGFIFDFGLFLSNHPVSHMLKVSDNTLEMFAVKEDIFEDGLTKDRLMTALNSVFRAKQAGVLIILKEFGPGPGKPGKSGSSASASDMAMYG